MRRLWSHVCPGQNHCHPGPRMKVPMVIMETHKTMNPNKKCADGKLALLPGVIARSERVRINIRNDHQTKDDERRHDHAGNPRIEVHQHFLQPEEVPGGFCRVHSQVGIGRFFQAAHSA